MEGARPARVLIVDAEDRFTGMLAHQMRHLGHNVEVHDWHKVAYPDDSDLMVIGPGPGDPRDDDDPKVLHLRRLVDDLLAARRPFLAVCLGHQVLCHRLGLELTRRDVPNQGRQIAVDLFGTPARLGFYNTFVARSVSEQVGNVLVSRDSNTFEVYATRGPHFSSFQFHPESVLSTDGLRVLAAELAALLAPR